MSRPNRDRENKKNKNIVNDAIGDPAFYNDQIGENKEPMRSNITRSNAKSDNEC